MLPHDGHERKDTRNKDRRERDLADRPARERLDLVLTPRTADIRVPSRKRGQEKKRQEGEDDGDDEQVGEDDGVLEGVGHPDEVQRVLVDVDEVSERGGVVVAEEGAIVGLDAEAEVADADFEVGSPNDVGDGGCYAWLDLCGVEGGRVVLVIEGY